MNLPREYVITGGYPKDVGQFLQRLQEVITRGFNLIQLRAKELPNEKYKLLASEALKICEKYRANLILNTSIDIFLQSNAHGLHLTSSELMKLHKRPIANEKLLSAACHDEEQLQQAANINVDFVTLSPVLATNSHPDAQPLGWDEFKKLCNSVNIPIYALGGMKKEHLSLALQNGAYGIAAINAFWY
jgi:thiamine-phosphate diphosphorylase